jgi:hypothetical protein
MPHTYMLDSVGTWTQSLATFSDRLESLARTGLPQRGRGFAPGVQQEMCFRYVCVLSSTTTFTRGYLYVRIAILPDRCSVAGHVCVMSHMLCYNACSWGSGGQEMNTGATQCGYVWRLPFWGVRWRLRYHAAIQKAYDLCNGIMCSLHSIWTPYKGQT